MKYLFIALAIFLCIPFSSKAQDNKDFGIKWGGFIRNDMIFNSRQVLSARGESMLLLAPLSIDENADGDDLNAVPNLNLIGINSRINGKISGPDAFGAKTSAFVEGDFYGTDTYTKFSFRLRHAMMKFDWEKTQLLVGQYWHPAFITDCFANTVSFGAGVPFNPLSRNPQFRFTYKLNENTNVFIAAMGQGHFKSKAGAASQQNAAMPEMHIQLQYKTETMAAGFGINYLTLKPFNSTEVFTDNTFTSTKDIIAKNNVSGLSLLGYFKMKTDAITIKWWGQYGKLNDNMVMLGGYYPVVDSTMVADDLLAEYVRYTPISALSTWFDVSTNAENLQFGLFVGYIKNMGASLAEHDIIASTYTGRWGDVNSMMRIAPRAVFISGQTNIGLEIEYSTIDYASQKLLNDGSPDPDADAGGMNDAGKVTNWTTANNIKFVLSFVYKF